jgi:hypothetical protein
MDKQIAGHQDAQLTWKETRRMHIDVQAASSAISLCLFIFCRTIFSASGSSTRLDRCNKSRGWE